MSGGTADRVRTPRIALISGTPTAIAPAVAGLAEEFPSAEPWNLLDDRLLADAPEDGPLPPALVDRMGRLIGYALAGGADGVLLTCSLYGSVTEAVETPVPLLAPDTAAFERALTLSSGNGRVLVLASFEAAMRDSVTRFSAAAAAAGSATEPVGVVAPDAFDAAREGDLSALSDALRDACLPHIAEADAVLLAQYSLASAAAPLSTTLNVPVVSGPRAAAAALRSALTGRTL
ncbi:aspartate/glutamate racemase family protein [Streptomyces sp. NBC_01433]|uniref:aspartate/glutamate racemase family protein n=1 Tax=Streptomyces sp. NBC_01433 TaxID=2903864 RepID=UPI00224CE3E8|nr:aspartate/glutamate racemase family protein [Streptomyces sp. NBC_01433]MCX4679152.1 aspartate/glutamate racemase family protein [Streptomyces sp. NBC_01433]